MTIASKSSTSPAAFEKSCVNRTSREAAANQVLLDTKTRIGQISFINSLPIVLPLERGDVELNARTTLAPPAQLNRLIAEGALDVSAMSSFGYLSMDGLAYIPDVSISCSGPVGSVLLFSKHSLDDLANSQRIVVTSSQSASSVNLFKILMLEQFGKVPTIMPDAAPEIDAEGIDAVLVIGDQALEVDTAWSTRYLRIDMGDWWWRTHNLPMVFGLWAARMDWIDNNPSVYATIGDALRQSKSIGLSSAFDAVLDEAEQRTGLARSRLQNYYRAQLNFDLTAKHLEGLKLFKDLAQKHGLL